MRLNSSLGEAFSIFHSLFDNHGFHLHSSSMATTISGVSPSQTKKSKDRIQNQGSLITPPPELRARQEDCSAQASRSATQAIREAQQQASESIRQASQSASQASQQAAQSASNEIRQATERATQTIAEFSRSVTSIQSSASSAISSVQSSASQALARANSSLLSLQGAGVTRVRADVEAAASSQVANAGQRVTASETTAVTATQAAVAIVGSIIASTLITILIFFLVARHKKKLKRQAQLEKEVWPPESPKGKYPAEPRFARSDQFATTAVGSERPQSKRKPNGRTESDVSLSMFPETPKRTRSAPGDQGPSVKTTSVPWNPSNPPKAPTLAGWLKVQDTVSPFGPIKLPDNESDAPLGGQLKSPHRSQYKSAPATPRYANDLPLRSPRLPELPEVKEMEIEKPSVRLVKIEPMRKLPTRPNIKGKAKASPPYVESPLARQYEAARAAVWTDSPATVAPVKTQTPPLPTTSASTQGNVMKLPSPRKSTFRDSAEWAAMRQQMQTPETPAATGNQARGGLPSGPRASQYRGGEKRSEGPGQPLNAFGYGARMNNTSGLNVKDLGANGRRSQLGQSELSP